MLDIDKRKLMKKRIELKYSNELWVEIYSQYHKTILLFITGKCNLACVHCFNIENLNMKSEMSFDYIKTIIDNNPDIEKYDIMGGEPLLHKDIYKILDYLENKNKKIGLYTNGMLLGKKLPKTYKNLRLNMAFHSLESDNMSHKPISMAYENIKKYAPIYPTKIVFLMTESNKNNLKDFANFIEYNVLEVKKLTIGIIRDESDYYDDEIFNILGLEEYSNLIQKFVLNYNGRLDIDIFAEGILYTNNLPKSKKNQINRFRCVFPENKMTTCLYDVGTDKKVYFDPMQPIKFNDCSHCPWTNKRNCLTDKIKLTNKKIV